MAKILLVRHGETDWNRMKRVMGHLDIPLNDIGIKQVAALAEMLKAFPFSAVYSSPLKRTMQTAKIISAHRNLSVIKEKKITEIDFGEWVGKYSYDLKNDSVYRQFLETPGNIVIPGGEGIAEVQKRGVDAVEQIHKRHEGDTVVMVSHCDSVRTILSHYMQMDINNFRKFSIDNGSLSIIDFGLNNNAVISSINYLCDEGRLIGGNKQ